jgi:hypothetical protein
LAEFSVIWGAANPKNNSKPHQEKRMFFAISFGQPFSFSKEKG